MYLKGMYFLSVNNGKWLCDYQDLIICASCSLITNITYLYVQYRCTRVLTRLDRIKILLRFIHSTQTIYNNNNRFFDYYKLLLLLLSLENTPTKWCILSMRELLMFDDPPNGLYLFTFNNITSIPACCLRNNFLWPPHKDVKFKIYLIRFILSIYILLKCNRISHIKNRISL